MWWDDISLRLFVSGGVGRRKVPKHKAQGLGSVCIRVLATNHILW